MNSFLPPAVMLAFTPMCEEKRRYFDTHVHLDRLGEDRSLDEELKLARRAKVGGFLVPGVRPWDWADLLRTVSNVPGALAAPGVHPMVASCWSKEVSRCLEEILRGSEVVALGEVGLDGLLSHVPMVVQEEAFRGQIRLAIDLGRPLIIHCRKASQRLLSMLKQEQAERIGGIFHGFSGSRETAMEAIRLNFAIGFGGPITYPKARRTPEVLAAIPAEWIVLETDAPDLPPHPHKGEGNRPCYLESIASRVAEIRGWSPEETAGITTANALRVLKVDPSYRQRYFFE